MPYKEVRLSQQGVILNSQGEVLIVKNAKSEWLLPGGRMEEGEMDPEKALLREIEEETGITDITIGEPVGTDMSQSGDTYAIAFLCTTATEPKPVLSSEHSELQWAKPSELPKLLYYTKIGKAIAKYLQ